MSLLPESVKSLPWLQTHKCTSAPEYDSAMWPWLFPPPPPYISLFLTFISKKLVEPFIFLIFSDLPILIYNPNAQIQFREVSLQAHSILYNINYLKENEGLTTFIFVSVALPQIKLYQSLSF